MAVPPPPGAQVCIIHYSGGFRPSDKQGLGGGGGGGCSTYNGLYGEVPWLPLERNILFFCSGFKYEWVGISPVEVY